MHWAVCSDLGPRSLLIIEVMSARVAGGPGNVPGRDLRRRFPDNQRQLQMAALSLSPARPTNQVQPAAGCPACTKCGGGEGGEGDHQGHQVVVCHLFHRNGMYREVRTSHSKLTLLTPLLPLY